MEYEIHKLLDVRMAQGRREFLVSWAGFAASDNTCAIVPGAQSCRARSLNVSLLNW